MRGVILIVVAAIAVSGCAEGVVIYSRPQGASAYVNDTFVGLTPTIFSTHRSEMRKHYAYRIQKEGHVPAEGVLGTEPAPGRIVASVFTLGILLVFKSPTRFRRVEADLQPLADTRPDSTGTITERLERLESAHEHGLVSEQEYRRLRAKILQEF